MIGDAKVEVFCDGPGCGETIEIELRKLSSNTCSILVNDIEQDIASECGWITRDGQHLCEFCIEAEICS